MVERKIDPNRELERNARLKQIALIKKEGLDRLQKSTVAVLGLGHLGGQLIHHLALLGISLILVDCDIVKEENLGTQGFTPDQLGMPKVQARAQTLAKLNPICRVQTISCDIESLGLAAFLGVDLIACCLDSRRIRAVVNELAVRSGVPFIDSAIDGTGQTLMGRVAAYSPRQAESPCFLCSFEGDSLLQVLQEGVRESCTYPRWSGSDHLSTAPTIAFSALGAAVGSWQTIWVTKMLLGQGQDLIGRELYVDLDGHRLDIHLQKRNPRCVFDHRIFSMASLNYSNATVQQTFSAAEEKLGKGVLLQLHRRALVTALECPDCLTITRPYHLFDGLNFNVATCVCGSDMGGAMVSSQDHFTRADAMEFSQKKWKELGLPENDVVTALKGDTEVHFVMMDLEREGETDGYRLPSIP